MVKQNSFHTFDVNWGPRLETTSEGIACRWNKWSISSWSISSALGSLGNAAKCAALEKQSIIDRITVFPGEGGRPVKKSRVMCDQEGLGLVAVGAGPLKERSVIYFGDRWCRLLHTLGRLELKSPEQAPRNEMVRWIPGWHENHAHWSTWACTDEGT